MAVTRHCRRRRGVVQSTYPHPGSTFKYTTSSLLDLMRFDATNQIELSPYLQNRALATFLHSQGITPTSYMTLAYGKVLKDPVLTAIAAKHGATPAQVALAWALRLGYAVIPSSTKREHLASNLLAQQLRLDDDDMARIVALERNGREVDPEGLAPAWD